MTDPIEKPPDVRAPGLEDTLLAADHVKDPELRRALIKLAAKIDAGFSSFIFFMNAVRDRIPRLQTQIQDQSAEMSKMKDTINEMQRWIDTHKVSYEAKSELHNAEKTLAKLEGRNEAMVERKQDKDKGEALKLEFAKLSTTWKVAVAGGLFSFLVAVASVAQKIVEFIFK